MPKNYRMTNLTLSLFKGYADTSATETTLAQLVQLIREDATLRTHTEKYRFFDSQGDGHTAQRIKSGTPCFAVTVRLKGGKQKEHINGWTGLCLADFDHIPPEALPQLRQLLAADKHTLLAYTTISGKGLRVIYHTAIPEGDTSSLSKHHAELFKQGNRYYERLLHLNADAKCKNVNRLSGLAHDSEVYFNPAAIPFVVTNLNRVVAAIEREVARQGASYEAGSRNDYIMRTGYLMNQYGVPESEATTWAEQRFCDYDGDVAGIYRACYLKTEEHGTLKLRPEEKRRDSAHKWATVSDIEAYLQSQGLFRHNTATGKTEYSPNGTGPFVELDDRTENSMWRNLSKEGKLAKIQELRSVLASDFVPRFNPFVDYFEALPPWDGHTDYIAQLAAMVETADNDHPTPATRATEAASPSITFEWALRKWLVAMVASLLNEQVINHEILVLVGPQGIYKTTWLQRLLPPPLQRYFFTKSNNHHIGKDDMFTLTEFAIICLEEIEELRPAELNQLKAIVTMKEIHERAAYGHHKEHRPRTASFCGTSNHTHFLTDPSGNRRWMPFEVVHIQDPYTTHICYEGVYAQAYALWKQGFVYWLKPQETEQLNRYNQRFEVANPEYELLQTYFRKPEGNEECIFATTSYILSRINGCLKQTLSPTRLSQALKRLGYIQFRRKGQRGYHVVELKPEEVRLRMKSSNAY